MPEMSESLRASALPQFDLLWFDLMTKTRQLIEDVCAPIMDRLETHKCQLVTLERSESSQSERLHLLEDLFLQKNQKNSAFDAITERMLDMVRPPPPKHVWLGQRQKEAPLRAGVPDGRDREADLGGHLPSREGRGGPRHTGTVP